MLFLSDFHLLMHLSPELPIQSSKASALRSMSQGTPCSRWSASKLSMPDYCAWDQPEQPATKVALTLTHFKIIFIQSHTRFVSIMGTLTKTRNMSNINVEKQVNGNN